MKTVVLYRENSEQRTPVEAFIRDYEKATGLGIERVELDSIRGAELAQLYGVDAYPAILVTRTDGSLYQMWQGMQLPPVEEVEHAARA